ncbi:MAG: beta-ketoacyl synthase chain length factor [Zoogloeaceae bacterium]|jgi:hypothetical protein|nr:beta-ketoacyl synthase chain length factor [Zoogloeaceae bacterium]
MRNAPGFRLLGWSAWTPGAETREAWLAWAKNPAGEIGGDLAEPAAAPARSIPAMLRRRADLSGRAALHVMTDENLRYTGQSVILASRIGEFSRAFALLRELARVGQVSPQQFSMAVHHASGGLFMMCQKARAPLTAVSAQEETALSGLLEAQIQIAEGESSVWLVCCDEPLPAEYRVLSARPDANTAYFACVLELAEGKDFSLVSEDIPARCSGRATALDVLSFFLAPRADPLYLSRRGGWALCRTSSGEPSC